MESYWYSYGRVSPIPKLHLLAQRRKNWRRYKLARLHEGLPELKYGQFHADLWDMRRVPFLERPVAQSLWTILRPGDCLITASFDLAFYNAEDLRSVAKQCQLGEITLIVNGQRYNTSRMNEQSLRQRYHRMRKTINLRGIRRSEYEWFMKSSAGRASQ